MSFNSQYSNKIVMPSGSLLNVRELPSVNSVAFLSYPAKSPAGRTTGQFMQMADGNWFQVVLYTAVKKSTGREFGYVREDVIKLVDVPLKSSTPPSKEQAQSLLDELNTSDRVLFAKIVSNFKLISQAKAKGVDVSVEEAKLKTIIRNYAQRRVELRETKVFAIKSKLENFNAALANILSPSFAVQLAFLLGPAIGSIGTLPVYVVDLMVVGAISLIIYLMLTGFLQQSKIDTSWSNDLDAALKKKLSPEEYKKLATERDAMVQKAFAEGKKSSSILGNVNGIVWGVAAIIGIWKVVPLFTQKSA